MSKVAFSANLKMSANVCTYAAEAQTMGWLVSKKETFALYMSRDFKCWSHVLSSAEVIVFHAHCLREHLDMPGLEVSESRNTMDGWKATPVISDSSLRAQKVVTRQQ